VPRSSAMLSLLFQLHPPKRNPNLLGKGRF
jgi:hypothetical protein